MKSHRRLTDEQRKAMWAKHAKQVRILHKGKKLTIGEYVRRRIKEGASPRTEKQSCEYHGKFTPTEWNDWQCPKCGQELMQFAKWRKTDKWEDAPINLLERTGALTVEQAKKMRARQEWAKKMRQMSPRRKGGRGQYALTKYFTPESWAILAESNISLKTLGEAVEISSKRTGKSVDDVAKDYFEAYFTIKKEGRISPLSIDSNGELRVSPLRSWYGKRVKNPQGKYGKVVVDDNTGRYRVLTVELSNGQKEKLYLYNLGSNPKDSQKWAYERENGEWRQFGE